jgi:hypothetical protein
MITVKDSFYGFTNAKLAELMVNPYNADTGLEVDPESLRAAYFERMDRLSEGYVASKARSYSAEWMDPSEDFVDACTMGLLIVSEFPASQRVYHLRIYLEDTTGYSAPTVRTWMRRCLAEVKKSKNALIMSCMSDVLCYY